MPFSRELFPLRRSVLFCVQVCALATVATQEPFANCFPNMLHQNGMQKYSFSQNFFDSALPSAPAARQMTPKQWERVIFWSRICGFQPWMCSSFFEFVLFALCICTDFGHNRSVLGHSGDPQSRRCWATPVINQNSEIHLDEQRANWYA